MTPTELSFMDHGTGSWDLSAMEAISMATPGPARDPAPTVNSTLAGPTPAAMIPKDIPPSGDATAPAATSAPIDVRKSPIKKSILADPAVQSALAVAQKMEADFRADLEVHRVQLHPDDSVKAARRILNTSTNAQEIGEAARMISEMSSPAALEAQVALARLKWHAIEPLKAAVESLVVAALARVEVLKSDAREAEESLFAAFNLTRERTGVSARLDVCGKQLSEILAGLRSKVAMAFAPGRAPTGCEHRHVLDWFVF